MVKNELRCISAGSGSRHRRSSRQTDENSAYEVTAPPLIRGEGGLRATAYLAHGQKLVNTFHEE